MKKSLKNLFLKLETMIIKSMSRKSTSFTQLYDYLTREADDFCFTKNTYSNIQNKKELLKEFYHNAEFLKNSRGKVYLYHELLSLKKNNLSKLRQKEILLDLANRYLEQRANNHLSFGVIHEDKAHIHLHLMISANEIESEKRVRLSKTKFASIQKNLELYKNEKYIELQKSSLYQEQKDFSKEKQKEQEIRHKRNTKTIKDEIKQNLENAFKKVASKTYFDNHIKSLEYEFYTRGTTTGIIYQGKKYRLKTLGLENEYKAMNRKLEKIKDREIKRQRYKEDRNFERTR